MHASRALPYAQCVSAVVTSFMVEASFDLHVFAAAISLVFVGWYFYDYIWHAYQSFWPDWDMVQKIIIHNYVQLSVEKMCIHYHNHYQRLSCCTACKYVQNFFSLQGLPYQSTCKALYLDNTSTLSAELLSVVQYHVMYRPCNLIFCFVFIQCWAKWRVHSGWRLGRAYSRVCSGPVRGLQ